MSILVQNQTSNMLGSDSSALNSTHSPASVRRPFPQARLSQSYHYSNSLLNGTASTNSFSLLGASQITHNNHLLWLPPDPPSELSQPSTTTSTVTQTSTAVSSSLNVPPTTTLRSYSGPITSTTSSTTSSQQHSPPTPTPTPPIHTRSSAPPLPTPAVPFLSGSVVSHRPRLRLGKSYTEFEIQVVSPALHWECWKRYSEFASLHQELVDFLATHPDSKLHAKLPKLPPSKLVGNMKEQFLEKRLKQLDQYLNEILALEQINSSIPVLKFLGALEATSPSGQRKEKKNAPAPLSHLHLDGVLPILDAGDIVLFRTNGVLQGLQRTFTSSKYDHVGIVIRIPWSSLKPSSLHLLESTSDGVRTYHLARRMRAWYASNAVVAIRQLKNVKRTNGFLSKLDEFVSDVDGLPYGLTLGKLLRREPGQSRDNFFCSELVATAYMRVGLINSSKYAASSFYPSSFNQENSPQELNLCDGAELGPEVLVDFVQPAVSQARVNVEEEEDGLSDEEEEERQRLMMKTRRSTGADAVHSRAAAQSRAEKGQGTWTTISTPTANGGDEKQQQPTSDQPPQHRISITQHAAMSYAQTSDYDLGRSGSPMMHLDGTLEGDEEDDPDTNPDFARLDSTSSNPDASSPLNLHSPAALIGPSSVDSNSDLTNMVTRYRSTAFTTGALPAPHFPPPSADPGEEYEEEEDESVQGEEDQVLMDGGGEDEVKTDSTSDPSNIIASPLPASNMLASQSSAALVTTPSDDLGPESAIANSTPTSSPPTASSYGYVYTWGKGAHCLGVPSTSLDASSICPFATKVVGPTVGDASSSTTAPNKKRRTQPALKCTSISCGESMSACVSVDGGLYTWGSGAGGRLGHGNQENYSSPCLVMGLSSQRVIQVSCGESHAGCIVAAGFGYVWGKGNKGSLGDGIAASHQQLVPKLIMSAPTKRGSINQATSSANNAASSNPLDELTFIDCSYLNTGVINRAGEAFLFGSSEYGKLGFGSTESKLWPTKLILPTNHTASTDITSTSMTASSSTSSTTHADSTSTPSPISYLSLGSTFSGFVTRSGELWMCGYGAAGNLGQGNRNSSMVPLLVTALKTAGEQVVRVACTRSQITLVTSSNISEIEGHEQPHTLVVTQSGHAYSFGTAHKGILGNMKNKTLSPQGADELLPYRIGTQVRDVNNYSSNYLNGMHVRDACASSIHSAVLGTWTKNSGTSSETETAATTASSTTTDSSPASSALSPSEVLTFGCGSDGRMGCAQYMSGLSGGRSRLKCYVSQPSPVVGLEGKHVLQIASARRHMIALVAE